MDRRPDRANLLIVDDAATNIRVLNETLKADYDIRFALSGAAALDIAREPDVPDLILLDIAMPGMDGYEVCRQLKADPRTESIPVIFLTARTEPRDEQAGFSLGAADYVVKPFRPEIVKARIETHLALKCQRDHLEELVADRTRELQTANCRLREEIKKHQQAAEALGKRELELQEANVALKVLLKRVNQDKADLAENVMTSVQKRVLPYIEKIRKRSRDGSIRAYLDLLNENLRAIVTPFFLNSASVGYGLTPTEIEVADFIRAGKTTKEIAQILNVSSKAVEYHRDNLREKLGIKHTNANLKTRLQALQDS